VFTDTNEIRIENSTICNYHCTMCPREKLTRPAEVMDTALYQSIVERATREMPWITNTCLSGFGEFATDPQWRQKLAIAARSFQRVHIVTNLSLLDEEDLRAVLESATDIRISLYARSEEVFAAVHHPPAGISCRSLDAKILFLIERRRPGQRVVLSWLETGENRTQTEDWIAAWSGKADLIEVWKPHNWIDGRQYRSLCGHRVPSCGRPRTGPIQVQVDGTVNVCCFDYNGELLVGDLRTQGFREIFEGAGMEQIQRLHAEGRADELVPCRICDQRNCVSCKSAELVHTSGFRPELRVSMTSTVYETLLRAEDGG
jgi:hypothetical protein